MFVALSPYYVIAASIVLLMLISAFIRNHKLIAGLSALGIIVAFITTLNHCWCMPSWASSLLIVDKMAYLFIGITLVSSLFINIFSFYYFEKSEEQKEEYYILFNTAILGTLVMLSAKHFVSFFLGLELLSIPLYVMIAYLRHKPGAVEAGIKYLTLAGASSAALLFGLALIYATSGSMDIYAIGTYFKHSHVLPGYALLGVALFIASIGFKLAMAPFHMWAPDVYQGASAPVTSFLASVAKGGTLAFVIRFFSATDINGSLPVFYTLCTLSILSMFVGNILALRQNNIKRLLAFSSIAHMGYIFIALIAGGNSGTQAAIFYAAAYFITSVAAFAVIAVLSGENEFQLSENIKGLYFKKPLLAMTMAVAILSLAGMPLTAGFIAKFFLVFAGVGSHNWWLVWLLIINSAIGLYYYLKVVTTMFSKTNVETEYAKTPVFVSVSLSILMLILVWLGVAPGGLMSLF